MSSQKPEAGHDVHDLVSLYALKALDNVEKLVSKITCSKDGVSVKAIFVLSLEFAGAIAKSVPARPSPQLRERLSSQLRVSAAWCPSPAGGLLIPRSDELAWQALAPGIAYKPL